ncbi:NUDIX hydrolase [Rhizobium sp. YIM 134829]|uniref:NUDIX hydrolase n=1 Tax=Rhizobium sp. YIM 134829 TaxID=3390453 RepID=UPI0039791E8E
MSDRERAWKVLETRPIVEDRWMRLRADVCETPSGQRIAPYYVLDYPDWVAIVAVTPEAKLVLVRQYRHGAGRVLLECVAGAIDPEDPDPAAAAARELKEETGYSCDRMIPLGALYANPSMQANRMHSFLALNARPESAQRLEAGEEGLTVERLPIQSVLAGLGGGLIGQSMHVAAILLALPHLTALGLVSPGAGEEGASEPDFAR